jgi:hypothetical protein
VFCPLEVVPPLGAPGLDFETGDSRTRWNFSSALMCCNTVWVPHPRDAFVFVARVGEHDANLLGRTNNPALCRRWQFCLSLSNCRIGDDTETISLLDPAAHSPDLSRVETIAQCRRRRTTTLRRDHQYDRGLFRVGS